MANLNETPQWEAGIYQLETSDPVLGGQDGISNRQAKQLANRTAFLKAQVEAGSGIVAGTYAVVTVNNKGLATAGRSLGAADIPTLDWSKIGSGRPTNLAGYGITDAAHIADAMLFRGEIPSGQIGSVVDIGAWRVTYSGASRSLIVFNCGGSVGPVQFEYAYDGTARWRNLTDGTTWSDWRGFWHSGNFDPMVKADKASTLAGYGITDAASASQLQMVSPPGKVAFFAMSTAPGGWLVADGSAVSRTTYAALFTAIGTTFGAGNGSTTFNLPDLRGQFIRGWSGPSGMIDPGRAFGSTQSDLIKLSDVWASYWLGASPPVGSTYPVVATQSASQNASYQSFPSSSNNETRPRNIALLACIKT